MKRIITILLYVVFGIGAIFMIGWSVWFNWYDVKASADYPLWSWLAYLALILIGLWIKSSKLW